MTGGNQPGTPRGIAACARSGGGRLANGYRPATSESGHHQVLIQALPKTANIPIDRVRVLDTFRAARNRATIVEFRFQTVLLPSVPPKRRSWSRICGRRSASSCRQASQSRCESPRNPGLRLEGRQSGRGETLSCKAILSTGRVSLALHTARVRGHTPAPALTSNHRQPFSHGPVMAYVVPGCPATCDTVRPPSPILRT